MQPGKDAATEQTLSPRYDPTKVERAWYDYWLEQNLFRAEVNPDREPVAMVIPPPNVTGSLHMGHALNNTLQDILIRRFRMQGKETLWLPGTDHAGIATQYVVEKRLAEEGQSRQELGRTAFLAKVLQWKDEYEARILGQLKRLGASCDWSRTRFTMDEGCSRAVREVFVALHQQGLIYQGDYIVNWCPRCQTTLADLEVEHEEHEGRLYHIEYPLADGGSLVVATTRPETMLGDTGVAVHPEDERYARLVGGKAILPVMERPLAIVADPWVDREFGSGAVKITPGHDPNDFELGRRHDLPIVQVIDFDGRMTDKAGPFAGLDRYECRKRLVAELERLGRLRNVEEHTHAVGHCYRCNTVVEPLVSRQWFVRMQPLAEPAMAAVREGRTRIVPERFAKVYFHWLENIRDWPVSRQIWWGHRIPAWYCENGHTTVATEDPAACSECGSRALRQDPDVLDTWFSSALWPFSTLGWPEDAEDLRYFYPTTVLVTGYDILFFWVARMMFMGLEFMKDVPFHWVLLHGLVRDADGKKMSKSLGNVIDPEEVIAEYGADALRWSLITGVTPGNDVRLPPEKIQAARDFANKLWNAARFVLMHLEETGPLPEPAALRLEDRWILHRLNATTRDVDRLLERFEVGEAAQTLYQFIWHEFCDWYIELVKPRLSSEEAQASTARAVLCEVTGSLLRLLHPFMPFITEEIWRHLPGREGSIVRASWPQPAPDRDFAEDHQRMEQLMELIRALRSLRSEFRLDPARPIDVIANAENDGALGLLQDGAGAIRQLANVKTLEITRDPERRPQRAATAVTAQLQAYVPLAGLIDLEAEVERLEQERDDASDFARRLEQRLADDRFVQRAPHEVVERERQKFHDVTERIQRLEQRIQQLRG